MWHSRIPSRIKHALKQILYPEPDRFENDRLYLPRVYLPQTGTTHRAVLRLTGKYPVYTFELEQIDPARFDRPSKRRVSFMCNVCGITNKDVSLDLVSNREAVSCSGCHSSLRMRSVVNALSVELFGKSIPLMSFPESRHIQGLGLSDWEGYARLLGAKFSYTNTFYHQEPRLDIANIPKDEEGKYDFIISSDVMEHVPFKDLSAAFTNMYRMLKPGGFLLLTVPYKPDGDTVEYYPDLYDFRFVTTKGKTFLYNRTVGGEDQVFDNLVFHGGSGFTLEMRMYSESGLLAVLAENGFGDKIRIYCDNDEGYGILWPVSRAVPLVARKA